MRGQQHLGAGQVGDGISRHTRGLGGTVGDHEQHLIIQRSGECPDLLMIRKQQLEPAVHHHWMTMTKIDQLAEVVEYRIRILDRRRCIER